MNEANWNQDGKLFEWLTREAGRAPSQGEVGTVLARAGVGKTAFLIQLALDRLLAGCEVLHVALGGNLSHVESRYEELATGRLQQVGADQREATLQQLNRQRAIQALSDTKLTPARLKTALSTFQQHLGLHPSLVALDGADFEHLRKHMQAVGELAQETQSLVWISVKVPREESSPSSGLPATIQPAQASLAWVVSLQPSGENIQAHLLKHPGPSRATPQPLCLSSDKLSPATAPAQSQTKPGDYRLFSGAAAGSEETFGDCAERWGLSERNFSFEGHKPSRTRGLVQLTEDELSLGDVSWTYLRHRMQREYEQTDRFRKVLRSIWHQVNPAAEVFCVGAIKPGGTVKGGTGWAVELAKQQNKPVWVFDQKLNIWYEWFGKDWRPCDPPQIREYRFCGTGTRHLKESGRQAIENLYQRSFGDPEAD
jgi:hypothetical protein